MLSVSIVLFRKRNEIFIFHKIIDTGIYRNKRRRPARDEIKRKIDKSEREIIKQQCDNHRNLNGRFPFPPFACGHNRCLPARRFAVSP